MIPFAQDCQRERPDILVQEDKAPAHASKWQAPLFSLSEVLRLLWPGNSPDLNMIEPAWIYLKRRTTGKGVLSVCKTAELAWARAWRKLPQHQIQAWIKRIPRHIKEVIRLQGGNEYQEGINDPVIN